MRVMNLCKPKTDNEVRHRCTVCLAEHVRVKANKGKEKK